MTIDIYASQAQQAKTNTTLKSVSMLTMGNEQRYQEEPKAKRTSFIDNVYNTLILGTFPFYRKDKKYYQ